MSCTYSVETCICNPFVCTHCQCSDVIVVDESFLVFVFSQFFPPSPFMLEFFTWKPGMTLPILPPDPRHFDDHCWLQMIKLVANLSDKSQQLFRCGCIGTSGSCTMVGCWKPQPVLPKLNQNLKQLWKNAVQISSKKRMRVHNVTETLRRDARGRLAYARRSPNYCRHKPGSYFYGTRGRRCSDAVCDTLCCGRGTKRIYIEKECHCIVKSWNHFPCKICSFPVTVCN